MAVDTKAKRFSMLNFGSVLLDLLPDPDAAMGQGDRQHFLDLYSGVLAGPLEVLQRYSVAPLGRDRSRVLVLTFRADDEGNVVVAFDGRDEPLLGGVINRIETAPNLQNPPDANWDVTLEDEWGRDVLGGVGLNRSNTIAEPAFPYDALGTSGYAERAVGKPLWLRIANAGEAKSGQVALFMVAIMPAR